MEMKKDTSVKWTDEQKNAIMTSGCDLLVAAAAGSGKTAVLVERIIKIVTDTNSPVDIDQLLIVTFTNAAAAEMRERIGNAIYSALDKNPNSQKLQKQLTLLHRARITTIHSFCLDVIRNNFHVIDIDPAFKIADETECLLIKMETLEELFEDKYAEDNNEKFLELVESYGNGRDDRIIQDIVLSLHGFIMSYPWPDKWLFDKAEAFLLDNESDLSKTSWGEELIKNIRIELLGLESLINKAINIISDTEQLHPYVERFTEDSEIIKKLIKVSYGEWDAIYNALSEISFDRLPACRNCTEEIKQKEVKDIRDTVKNTIKKMREEVFTSNSDEIISDLKDIYPIIKELSKLVKEFNDMYITKKRQKELMDFNDLEHLCLEILTEKIDDEEIVPTQTALEYRKKFHEIFIDEYQDSNLVQEVILKAIAGDKDETPNMFMVGDVKQSIYRFRHAKPELFLEKYALYSADDNAKQKKILLYKNFRSRKNIIDAVNFIFTQIMSREAGEIEYDDNEKLNPGVEYRQPEISSYLVGGEIELNIVDLQGDNQSDEMEPDNDFDDNFEENSPRNEYDEENYNKIEIEASLIAERILTIMGERNKERLHVYDKDKSNYRPVQYRDIVILLRATKDWCEVIRDVLESMGIPAYADTGTGYFNTVEIKTIMSLLQTIDNPLQDIPLLCVLRSPIYRFLPEELIDIRLTDKEVSFYEAMEKYIKLNEDEVALKIQEFFNGLNRWRDKALYMSTDELIWYIYDDTNYYSFVSAMPGGAQRQANLRLLFERARQFEETTYKGLFNFIRFIDKLKSNRGDMGSAKILGENENVVRIMSIHKSKGLEFPVVILSGMGKRFNMRDLTGKILYHQDMGYGPDYVDCKRRISYTTPIKQALKYRIKSETLSEEMRILYVAFTRAKEKLIITGCVNDLNSNILRWTSYADSSVNKVPEYEVMRAKSYLDWICTALARHKDGRDIRIEAGINNERYALEDNSKWELKFISKNDIINSISQLQNQISEDYIEKSLIDDNENIIHNEVIRRLDWKYKYDTYTKIPSKVTVTELKRFFNSELADEYAESIFIPSIIKKPAFLEGTTGLSAAEKGTVLHFIMQHIDINNTDEKAIQSQIDEMNKNELLTEQQAQSIDVIKIVRFFDSELGQRIINADAVYREIPFCIEIKCDEIYPSWCAGEEVKDTILLQGAVDCCFEENGKTVLIDFKTDFVPYGGEGKLKQMYQVQIDYYEKALAKIFDKPIEEKYIYLFWNNKIIKY